MSSIIQKTKRPIISVIIKAMRIKRFLADKEAIRISERQINFRGENGENYFHDLARNTPVIFIEKLSSVNRISKFFNRSPKLASLLANSSIRTIINLIQTPDNVGRYPLEYFLCFVTINDAISIEPFLITLINIINNERIKRPDWLEVKMLIVETNQTQSCVDFLPVIWEQKTQEDFRECLKTDRGKGLIRMAANDFRYTSKSNFTLCGVELKQYTHKSDYDDNLFDDIDIGDKNEVKLYLMQSWILLSRDVVDECNQKFIQKVEFFTHKASELGIDVIKLREQLIHSFRGDKRRLDELHKIMPKYHFWNSLEIINERGLLMQTVSLENRQASAQTSSVAL